MNDSHTQPVATPPVPANSGEGEKLREAIERAKTRAWDVYGVKWHYLEEISRFELVFAALATPDAAPIGSVDADYSGYVEEGDAK